MNRQPVSNRVITALYERLSHDDEQQGPSNSIVNQQQLLEECAKKHNFQTIVHFTDDGWSGTRWDRPDFNRMMAEIEAGNVQNLLVKDMSRMGRDHLRVGLCLETLREKGVRLIAVADGIDTALGEDDFMPFRNILAEWYARDTSRKVKAVTRAKGNAGKPLSNLPPFGFMKDPADKNKWLVDEPAATVVRRIFQMAMEGIGPFQIARTLSQEKVEKPSYHVARQKMAGAKPAKYDMTTPHAWSTSTVCKILSKPEYAGHTVNFRTSKKSFKDKKISYNPKEEWKVFPNTHEAIIDQETFDTVQRLRGTPRRMDSVGEPNPLTGLVFCADCGAKMYNSRQSKETYETVRYGKAYTVKTADYYNCSSYNLANQSNKQKCSGHYIRTAVIRDLVLDAIRDISRYALENEADFVQKVRADSMVQQADTAKLHKKQFAQNGRRVVELDLLFRKVYEDNATGKLTDERFEQLSGTYEAEQAELKMRNAGLEDEIAAFEADSENVGRFLKLARRHRSFEELTTPMLNEFVQKILVHKPDKSSGERVQKVDIWFNFIGNFELPKAEPTPEEVAAHAKRLEKLKKQREANWRHYEKKRREKEEREQPKSA
ncbi:MAG: recombinase family protein [Clostridiales bacterium]|jgi:DNA invertase Pin-like site-specific DNA recombinase|nr:recombinase family protein [Clostridiales bacterium]